MGKLNSRVRSECKLPLFIEFVMITVSIETTLICGEILNHRSPTKISLFQVNDFLNCRKYIF